MVERCGDRQRKCYGPEKWPLHLFVESLPLMLQITLLLLACGLRRYMASVNTAVACTLIVLTGLAVIFHVGTVISGTSSYDCPLQTPASVPLRNLWTKVGPRFIPVVLPTITALRTLGEDFWDYIFLSPKGARRQFRNLSGKIQRRLLRIGLRLPRTGLNVDHSFGHASLPTTQGVSLLFDAQKAIPWFAPGDLARVQMRNADDVR